MSIIMKLNNLIDVTGKISYKPDIKKHHGIQVNLFDLILSDKKASSFRIEKLKNTFKVCLTYDHDLNSVVEYLFKYNRDKLLLLNGVYINKKIMIAPNSIPDFAISARPFGSNIPFEWIPVHRNVKGVSLDNKLNIIDGDMHFEINQVFNAVNPKTPNEVLWIHTVNHKISFTSPYLEVTNHLKFIKDTEINNLYLTMLPVYSKRFDKLYLNNGIFFEKIPNDGTEIEEHGEITSAFYIGKNESGLNNVAVVDARNSKSSQSIITFRKDNVSKFYLNELTGIARKDDEFLNTQRIACVPGIIDIP